MDVPHFVKVIKYPISHLIFLHFIIRKTSFYINISDYIQDTLNTSIRQVYSTPVSVPYKNHPKHIIL